MRHLTHIFIFLTLAPTLAADDETCYTCSAGACYGYYEDQLSALRDKTAISAAHFEKRYVALVDSTEVEANELMAARDKVLKDERLQIKSLHRELIVCLQRAHGTGD